VTKAKKYKPLLITGSYDFKCKHTDCIHCAPLCGTGKSNRFCAYILDTGHSKGCRADNCVHYQKGKREPDINTDLLYHETDPD